MTTREQLEVAIGESFFDYQVETFDDAEAQEPTSLRLCLYFRTGAGKTITALAALALVGVQQALVVAPPITHPGWVKVGAQLGVEVEAISHAKFRMPGYLVSRHKAVIADEFHMFGGHGGAGWKKLDRLARSLKAPMILMSATPNYNDADRVYCIEHIMQPHLCKGGFLDFLHTRCETRANNFKMTPDVVGFKHYPDAAAYLAALPHVHYVPDNVSVDVEDIEVKTSVPHDLEEYGLDRRRGRIIASQMEDRHATARHLMVDDDFRPWPEVMSVLEELTGQATTPVLMFSASSALATALFTECVRQGARVDIITGKTTAKQKALIVQRFVDGELDVLIGTATLATGLDGVDKVCDTLIIVNDTDDDSLRRQLMGRILPRGKDADASGKQVFRLQLSA